MMLYGKLPPRDEPPCQHLYGVLNGRPLWKLTSRTDYDVAFSFCPFCGLELTASHCGTCNGSGLIPCPDGEAICRECFLRNSIPMKSEEKL